MMNFKSSLLSEELDTLCYLSNEALDFINACTDDWEVEYTIDFRTNETTYTLRVPMGGCHRDHDVELTATYVGDLNAMCALVEYLAHVNTLILNDCGLGSDWE